METIWEFKINGIVVEEPIGWDSVAITMQRDPVYQGLENIISDNIKFWDTGAQLITDEYELNGIDGSLTFDVFYSCDGGDTFNTLFTGIINCFFYEVINREVTVKLEPSGFHRKVKNRLNTPINLLSNISVGGETMSIINPFDLGLHSKIIASYAKETVNDSIKNFNLTTAQPFNPPLQIIVSDIEGLTEMSSYQPPIDILTNGSSVARTVRFVGSLKIANQITYTQGGGGGPTIWNYSGGFTLYLDNGGLVPLYTAPFDPATSAFYEINFDQEITLPASGSIKFYVYDYYANTHGPVVVYSGDWQFDSSFGQVEIFDNSAFDASTTKAFLIHETFAKISESITDEQDSFRSDYFGRTDSLPHSYAATGCGAWKAVTNGLNIRKMLDKNGAFFPIVTSFQELFDASDCERCLGWRVEKDYNTNKEYIRVEPREYFYNLTSVINLFNISDLKRTPAQDLIFNNFRIGYTKWNLNITGSNALDEFNSERSYSIPVKNAANKLERLSKYITSGYLIEQTRRLQYNTTPTNDFETDNDIFFISTNRASITSDLYTVPPVSTSYAAGEVSERDENFTSINNVLSPETCYNLRLSPLRNALKWYKWISASIWKHPSEPIKFISGTGNYQEGDTSSGGCILSDTITQYQDLVSSDIDGADGSPIFLPEYFEFTYPLSYSEFLTIMSNSEKSIQISCGGEAEFTGFIISLKYSPTTQGGIGEFKLIRGSCILGDFNNDFNNDFFTGTC